jgi:uncharacterized DUF497 family protein
MRELGFAWDGRKDARNRRKHGVSFEEARTVFYDENALLISDPEHSEDEQRLVLLGCSSRGRLLVVCHCYREGDAVIRIISAMKADRNEQRQYLERI